MESVWQNMEVAVADLPQVEDVNFQRHPIRYQSYRYLLAIFWWALPVGAFVVFSVLFTDWWAIYAGILLGILVALSFVGIGIGYRKRSYALRQNDLTYRKGWLFYSITTVPFNRIQHTEVSQGPLERKYELCTLNLYTAGGSTSDLSIPGLEQDEAQQLRDYIAKKAAVHV